jgi:hypothetical protein
MLFYLALFFTFLYFKIARVHKKEERPRLSSILLQHLVVGIAILSLLFYGLLYENLYLFIPILFVFATMASLMVTAVQLGIFVDGKPLFGLKHMYKYLPALRLLVLVFISTLWVVHVQNI